MPPKGVGFTDPLSGTLKSFVLIGLPASEAASALLVPLAAHELGHAVWRNRGIAGSAHATLQYSCEELYANNMKEFRRLFPEYRPNDIVGKEALPDTIADTVEYAVFQAEELFCDLFAYALFGEAYLHSFSYILAPGSGSARRFRYPKHATRIAVMRQVAKDEGTELPDATGLSFEREVDGAEPRERFVLRMAETGVVGANPETTISGGIPGLWSAVSKIISDGKVRRPNLTNSTKHLSDFRNAIPTHRPVCLGDIIAAGWMYRRELEQSRERPEQLADKLDQLNEILLKSVEVMEFRRRIDQA
jgi:hypothetical protein